MKKKLRTEARGLFQQLSNNKRCFECGKPAQASHHIVYKQECKFLEYDYRNAMPVCLNCHIPVIHKNGWKLNHYTDWEHHPYLFTHKNILLKQYLIDHGQTEEEFLEDRISELQYQLTGEY